MDRLLKVRTLGFPSSRHRRFLPKIVSPYKSVMEPYDSESQDPIPNSYSLSFYITDRSPLPNDHSICTFVWYERNLPHTCTVLHHSSFGAHNEDKVEGKKGHGKRRTADLRKVRPPSKSRKRPEC